MKSPQSILEDGDARTANSETEMLVKAAKLGWSSEEILNLRAIYGPAMLLEKQQPSLSQELSQLETEQ